MSNEADFESADVQRAEGERRRAPAREGADPRRRDQRARTARRADRARADRGDRRRTRARARRAGVRGTRRRTPAGAARPPRSPARARRRADVDRMRPAGRGDRASSWARRCTARPRTGPAGCAAWPITEPWSAWTARSRSARCAWVADRPLRLQHRSGALWILNSGALAALAAARPRGPAGLERDACGRASGRLYRGDAWLRERLGAEPPSRSSRPSARAWRAAASAARPTRPPTTMRRRWRAFAPRPRAVPCRSACSRWGRSTCRSRDSARVARGAVKALLDEPRLPDFDAFTDAIRSAHAAGRSFAVHCVTRAELVFAVEAFRAAGARPGDRLEHAALAPPDLVGLAPGCRWPSSRSRISSPSAATSTPRGRLRDLAWLYRAAAGSRPAYRSPRAATRPSVARSVARDRGGGRARPRPAPRSAPGGALARAGARALHVAGRAPGAPARGVAAGAAADLCLLDRPWRDARQRLSSDDVRATWCEGRSCGIGGARVGWERLVTGDYLRAPRTFAHHWRSA